MEEEKKFIEPISDREKFVINERISKNNVEIARLNLENARTQLEIIKTQYSIADMQSKSDAIKANSSNKSFFNYFKL